MRVRLTPSGGADRIDGVVRNENGEHVLKARVRAPPEDGRANAALEALLAKALGVAKGKVSVSRGTTARLKTVSVDGVEASSIEALFQRFPGEP